MGNADVFGSVILIGEMTKGVSEKLLSVCKRDTFHGMKRKAEECPVEDGNNYMRSGSSSSRDGKGKEREPLFSCSEIGGELEEQQHGSGYIFRFMAYNIESAYQLLAEMLGPLKDVTGILPYADRLHT